MELEETINDPQVKKKLGDLKDGGGEEVEEKREEEGEEKREEEGEEVEGEKGGGGGGEEGGEEEEGEKGRCENNIRLTIGQSSQCQLS